MMIYLRKYDHVSAFLVTMVAYSSTAQSAYIYLSIFIYLTYLPTYRTFVTYALTTIEIFPSSNSDY